MEPKKLKKLLKEVARLQAQVGNLKARQIIGLAKKCGYIPVIRGKEPTYKNAVWTDCIILNIPDHKTGYKQHTAKSILQKLEGVLMEQLAIAEENQFAASKEGRER